MTAFVFPPGPKTRFSGYYLAARHRDPLGFYRRLARDYGDLCHFQSGRQHVYCLNHPDFVREALVTRGRSFTKGALLTSAQRVLGEGLLTSDGDLHRQQRRTAAPAFHREQIAGYAATMADLAARQGAAWGDGQTLDINGEMQRLTATIVATTLFGTEPVGEFAPLHTAVSEVFVRLDAMTQPWSGWTEHLPTPSARRYRHAMHVYRTLIDRMIVARRGDPGRGDLLALLMEEEGPVATGAQPDTLLHDRILTFLLAGSITLAQALSWVWRLLERHPEAELRLHAEIDGELAGRPAGIEDVPRLAYTRGILAEALRLYPPVWTLGRRAIEACEIGGYPIPKGAIVLASPDVLHHDPRFFPEPLRFDPERWTPEAEALRPRYSYFPFGAGARNCIGEPFAWMEGVLLIATLAQQWRLRSTGRTPMRARVGFLLGTSRPLPMRAERRTAAGSATSAHPDRRNG